MVGRGKKDLVVATIRDLLEAKKISGEKPAIHYTEIARALNINPSYAAQLLRTYCPGRYSDGVCYGEEGEEA